MMPLNNDTICAISTPPGVGGIAVARISGPSAISIVEKMWKGKSLSAADSHTAHLGSIIDANGNQLDQAVATIFRNPRSFTGEDVVELSIHGSKYIQQELINQLINNGCRLAEPGEFTRRAFANGRMDLAEAEAVADVIASTTRAAHRLAISQMRGDFSRKLNSLHDNLLDLASLLELELDFSEEDVEFASRTKLLDIAKEIQHVVTSLASSFAKGSAIKDGIPVAIVGDTNAGKSTLLNTLLHDDRAIVSDIHGTTRDTIEDTLDINGVLFRLIDTAGIRETTDTIEAMGIQRTMQRISSARIILWVIDATTPQDAILATKQRIMSSMTEDQTILIALNKIDLCNDVKPVNHLFDGLQTIPISARDNIGIEALQDAMVQISGAANISAGDVIVTNARHYEALNNAAQSITRAIQGIYDNISGDFIAQDVRETLHYLSTITGNITSNDILSTIFSRFCIGK
jgi:tRNA modification GTPase